MTRRTKTVAALAAVTAAGLALSGCSTGGGDDGGDGQTLKLWHYEGSDSAMGKAWAEAIKIFEDETGAKVEFEEKSFEQIQKTASQVLDTDAAPDLMEFNKGNATAGFLASTGLISDISDAVDEYGWDDREVQRRRRHGRRHLVRHPELRRIRRRLLQRGRIRRGGAGDPDHL
jgi:raffinose/stachyose/melibiose transport system substrate-binding protein